MAKKRKKIIQDPVFGELAFDVLWCGHIAMGPLGIVEVMISGGNDGDLPTEMQRTSARKLQHDIAELYGTILEAIYHYYCDHRGVYLSLAIDPAVEVPVLSSPREVGRVLKGLPALYVGWHGRGETPETSFAWNTTFDEEHGIRVTLLDGAIQEVGP